MVNEQYAARLREKASFLPLSPGIYIMKNSSGKVIYVGKSRALKNRVSQYFHETNFKSEKTDQMTSHVYDFEYILCKTEIEALTLENSLIKLYKPKYNILLKDDKTYPYLVATLGEEYPRFIMQRNRNNKNYKYYGPYSGAHIVYSVIDTLHKTFGLPSCKYQFPKDIGKVKHCIYKQMGCIAPCVGKLTKDDYMVAFNSALSFLDGKVDNIINEFTKKMEYCSENLLFESAAHYRDRINAIKKLNEKQRVVDNENVERDIIGWYVSEDIISICIFFIRSGRLIDSQNFIFSGGEIFDSEALCSFITDFYKTREYIPSEVVLANEFDEEDRILTEEWLNSKSQKKVHLRVSKRGETHKLCLLVNENAKMKADENRRSTEKNEKALIKLANLCALEVVPERIEAFDISNFGNENITAGMVVYVNAKPKKSDYRVFKIKSTEKQDDYASMREALTRHISHWDEDRTKIPDLILLDGGKGHLQVVNELFTELGINVPVFGMVKDDFHKTRALVSLDGEISISNDQSVFTLIYGIQEEVHRFTITRMKQSKQKKEKTSILEKISGIGPQKAKNILFEMGGLANVKKASYNELIQIKGISQKDTENILNYFKKDNKK